MLLGAGCAVSGLCLRGLSLGFVSEVCLPSRMLLDRLGLCFMAYGPIAPPHSQNPNLQLDSCSRTRVNIDPARIVKRRQIMQGQLGLKFAVQVHACTDLERAELTLSLWCGGKQKGLSLGFVSEVCHSTFVHIRNNNDDNNNNSSTNKNDNNNQKNESQQQS